MHPDRLQALEAQVDALTSAMRVLLCQLPADTRMAVATALRGSFDGHTVDETPDALMAGALWRILGGASVGSA